MNTSLESILREAIGFEADSFDDSQDISGADVVQWFAEWRRRALHALQIVQDRVALERPVMNRLSQHGRCLPPTEGEIERLIHAINNGGIQITAGQFKVMVFKRTAKEASL